MYRSAHLQEAVTTKVTKRSSKPKRKDKPHHAHIHAHSHSHSHPSPAELLQTTKITRNLTLVKTLDDYELDESDTEADAVSQITRLTNIAKLVDDSTFHDDTLCQLLDAARLNLIGDQAKKALMRAARTRVDELSRQLLEREASRGTATPPLIIRKKIKKGSKPPATSEEPPIAPIAPMTAAPLAAPVTPGPVTTPLPAYPLSPQPTVGAAPSPTKEAEVLQEVGLPVITANPRSSAA